MIRPKLLVAVLGACIAGAPLLAGCEPPTAGDAPEIYSFSHSSRGRVIRWPLGSVIRIHLAEQPQDARAPLLDSALDSAIDLWNGAVRYGEFRLERTNTVDDAQIVMGWSDLPLPVTFDGCVSPIDPVRSVLGTAYLCGIVDFRLKSYARPDGTLTDVRFVLHISESMQAMPDAVPITVAHEIGHALGIWAHSPVETDLMYPALRLDELKLSARDRATIQTLYHTQPTISP